MTPELTTNGTESEPGLTLTSSVALKCSITTIYSHVPAAVPEPATWALASLGLAGLLAVRKRR